MSKDTVSAQKKFKEKYELPFALLADPSQEYLEKLGVRKEKNMYGKKVMGVVRTTLLVGADGKVEKVWSPVVVKGHAQAVLEAL